LAVILVDSSAWIAHMRGLPTAAAAKLESLAGREMLLVGDLILLEVLQGARDEAHARQIERALRQHPMAQLLDPELAVSAARNYRKLRDLGITVRKTIDIIIGTYCIEHGLALLHDDRDFAPMQTHLGLAVV
jgi:predicted nucleic acid-binding protein